MMIAFCCPLCFPPYLSLWDVLVHFLFMGIAVCYASHFGRRFHVPWRVYQYSYWIIPCLTNTFFIGFNNVYSEEIIICWSVMIFLLIYSLWCRKQATEKSLQHWAVGVGVLSIIYAMWAEINCNIPGPSVVVNTQNFAERYSYLRNIDFWGVFCIIMPALQCLCFTWLVRLFTKIEDDKDVQDFCKCVFVAVTVDLIFEFLISLMFSCMLLSIFTPLVFLPFAKWFFSGWQLEEKVEK